MADDRDGRPFGIRVVVKRFFALRCEEIREGNRCFAQLAQDVIGSDHVRRFRRFWHGTSSDRASGAAQCILLTCANARNGMSLRMCSKPRTTSVPTHQGGEAFPELAGIRGSRKS